MTPPNGNGQPRTMRTPAAEDPSRIRQSQRTTRDVGAPPGNDDGRQDPNPTGRQENTQHEHNQRSTADGRWLDRFPRSIAIVAPRVGCPVRGDAIMRCPACGATRRSKNDRRPPVAIHSRGEQWHCFVDGCRKGGDALTLALLALFGERPPKGDPRWRDARLRELADAAPVDADPTPTAPLPPAPRPPADEVERLYSGGLWPTEEPALIHWLGRRGLDPIAVEDRRLARALPPGDLPEWARCRGLSWADGWRCILPAYDATGALVSLRARWCLETAPPEGAPKAAAPAIGQGSASGLVLADGLGRELLRTGTRPEWWPPDRLLRVLVVEGEPDFLTWATRYSEGDETAPAVLGVWAGSWTDEIASRIPSWARVIIRTHRDGAGETYAERIIRSFGGRCAIVRAGGEVARG